MRTETSDNQRKSLAITIVVYGLLLVLLFFLRFWPPANMKLMGGGGGGGIEMNFGDSDYGMGDNYKSEVVNVKDQAKETPVQPTPEDDVIADDNSDNAEAVIPKKEHVNKTPVEVKKEVKPVVEKPKVSKNANDALSSLLGNKGGDGDDNKGGNKGSANGIWAPKAIMAMAAGQVLVVVMAVETAAVLEAEVALEMAVVAVEAMAAEEAIHLAIEKR